MIRIIFNYLMKQVLSPVNFAKFIGVKVGTGCVFYTKKFGGEPYLIEIGNDVQIAGNVSFWTHGGGWVLRKEFPSFDYFGKIKIGNNVYIGSDTGILPGVTIGNNVIIGAMSVVTKSIPDNTIVAGNPAKIVGNVNSFRDKILPYKMDIYHLNRFKKKKYILSQGLDKFVIKSSL